MAAASKKRNASFMSGLLADGQHEKRQRLPKTCEWILREPNYAAWKGWDDAASPILWIHGLPGCGKSFLAQYIIDNIKTTGDSSTVLSYFCDASTTPSSVLRSILAQLLLHPLAGAEFKEQITDAVEQLSSESHSAPLDTTYRLWDKATAILENAPPITLIIDGLDEVPCKYRLPQEFDFPRQLVKLTSYMAGYIRLLVLSRTEASLRSTLKDSPEIQITASKIRDDIESFIIAEVTKRANLVDLKDKIIPVILRQSEGIFQWATLAIKALSQDQATEKVLERLKNLSSSLDGLYARIIEQQSLELGPAQILIRNGILSLMLFTVRPLRLVEITNLLAVDLNVYIPDLEAKALEVCGSLIKVENGILKPMHASLYEFLSGNHPALKNIMGLEPSFGNLYIARALLAYLSHPTFRGIPEPLESDNFHSTHPLVEYATLYWIHHASLAGLNSNLQEAIQSFFKKPNAKEWADRLLPLFLHRSVLPIPPRPFNTARFFHLFSLKSQLLNCFEPNSKLEIDELISSYLCSTYEELLENARAQEGPESLSALQRLLDLAEVYSWCPKYEKQVPTLFQAALQVSSQLSSPEAQDFSLAAYQGLADEQKRNGKYLDAQKLLETLISKANNFIPTNDMRILFALDSLGWVCMRLGQLEPAATHLEKALEIATEQYGSQSPMTLRSKVTLAEVLAELGRHEEAEALCASLKEQLKQLHQNSIPLPKDSISHLNTLAAIFVQEGKFQSAEEAYKVVVDERRRLFGEEHRLTLWAEMQWGMVMDANGDKEAARKVLETLLIRQEKVLGSDHLDVKEVKRKLKED